MHQSRFFFPSDFFNQSHNSHAVANGLLLGHTQRMQTLSPPSIISSWGNYTPFPINLAVNQLQPECRGSGGAIKRSSPGGHDKSPFHGMNTVAAAPTELFFKEGIPTSPQETFGELNETAILTKSTPKQKSPKHEVRLFLEDKNHSQGGNSLHIKASTLDMVLQGWRGGTVRNHNKGCCQERPVKIEPWPAAVSPMSGGGRPDVGGVVAACPLRKGVEMGPVIGRRLSHNDIAFTERNHLMWEVRDSEGDVSLLEADEGCWMAQVRDALSDNRQNLEVVQRDGALYFRTLRDIDQGEELLAWYSPGISSFLGIPLLGAESESRDAVASQSQERSEKTDHPVHHKDGHLKCTVCNRGFNSRSNLRSHMRTHTLHRPFKCDFCKRGFSQSSTLKNHIRLHTGEKPYRCLICQSAYSQLAGLRAHQKSARHRPRTPVVTPTAPGIA